MAGDACAIIRIHNFLEKWGLVNYIHTKPATSSEKSVKVHKELKAEQKKEVSELSKRKDCFDRDKLIAPRSYGKDDLELLKKITRKLRPLCHFCEGICGVVWYEFHEKLHYQ